MSFVISEGTLRIEGPLSAEEADDLARALDAEGDLARVDLSACGHVHTAGVQLLLRRGLEVVAWPADSEWTEWLRSGMER